MAHCATKFFVAGCRKNLRDFVQYGNKKCL